MRRSITAGLVGVSLAYCATGLGTRPAWAQNYSVLRINEVIADNKTQLPRDVAPSGEEGSTTDMIEIYNSGSESLTIGFSNKNSSLALSDTTALPEAASLYTFRNGIKIQAGESLVIFCDGNASQDFCEPHANFNIASDGTEPITLWGPVTGTDAQGKPIRQVLDQVWLPPLDADVSLGRFPDGAGPAPVPVDDVLTTFVFNPPGTSTFGSCVTTATSCGDNVKVRLCRGAANGPGGNIAPHISLEEYSSNAPAAGEAVHFRVKVKDEKTPTPPNIASVDIVYRVNGGTYQTIAMTYDTGTGIEQGVIKDALGEPIGPNYFDLWTNWDGQIPGQAAADVVEFYLRVRDAQGGEELSPQVLCDEGVGPCDREFGGPGCQLELADKTCSNPEFTGVRYVECRKPFRYTVAYAPRPAVAPLVINEIVPAQDGILKDVTEPACKDSDLCPGTNLECCKYREDFIELYNNSTAQPVDLSGLWLSDGPFHPQIWQFPAGSIIAPEEYVIVWLDKDGGKCPDPSRPVSLQPCFWDCPDPTNPAVGEYHTSFALNADDDEIFLFDTEANKFGVVSGRGFKKVPRNHALALIPNGDRGGCWIEVDAPTPRAPNVGVCQGASFRRGDSNSSCGIDLSDAVSTLNFLFAGGPAPTCPDAADSNDDGKLDLSDAVFVLGYLFLGLSSPPDPGPDVAGPDPTPDDLEACQAPSC